MNRLAGGAAPVGVVCTAAKQVLARRDVMQLP